MQLLYTAHVPAGDGPFPTVVALHGWGASAHDLIGLAPVLHRGEALVLCPQGDVTVPIAEGYAGYGWFPLSSGGPPDPADFARGKASLVGWLDQALEQYPVDPRKLVLLGFSQGGVMAYDLALRQPERFAGLVALSSWLPDGLAGSIGPQPGLEQLPALVMHGTQDPMIPVAMGQQSRDALIKLGVQTTYREYEMGHEIRPDALRDLVEWLEQKVLSPIQLV
jgi:phospholipase/carboxylesterase